MPPNDADVSPAPTAPPKVIIPEVASDVESIAAKAPARAQPTAKDIAELVKALDPKQRDLLAQALGAQMRAKQTGVSPPLIHPSEDAHRGARPIRQKGYVETPCTTDNPDQFAARKAQARARREDPKAGGNTVAKNAAGQTAELPQAEA